MDIEIFALVRHNVLAVPIVATGGATAMGYYLYCG
jgi:hypothetical protein